MIVNQVKSILELPISSPFISNSAYEACDIAASDLETYFSIRCRKTQVKSIYLDILTLKVDLHILSIIFLVKKKTTN